VRRIGTLGLDRQGTLALRTSQKAGHGLPGLFIAAKTGDAVAGFAPKR
jgi:acyl CoA:acetate/3-ketoacid CoA transferase alpha subunit